MGKKRALVCSYHVPQPDRDSGSRRTFDSIRFLQEAGWHVTFLATDGVGDAQDARNLSRRGIAVFDGLVHDVEQLLSASRFDFALIAFWLNAERLIPAIRKACPSTRIVIDSIDLHFIRESRRVFQRQSADAPARFLGDKQGWEMVRELNAYAAADGVLAVSDKETGIVSDLLGDSALAYTVPDGEVAPPSYLPFSQRQGILSVGSFEHLPNVSAVEYLCKQVLPRLDRKLVEQHPVYIVGNALNDDIRNLAKDLPFVCMVGWVPSVEPYYAKARISVVPLLYGAGTKRKLVQALMMGTPTVSTHVGVEGLGLSDGREVLIADEPQQFAECIERLLTDEILWTEIADSGRKKIAETHDRVEAKQRFLTAVDAVLRKCPKKFSNRQQLHSPRRINADEYQGLKFDLRQAIDDAVPASAAVLVISKGDPDLLQLGGRTVGHFPQSNEGTYAGCYPADGASAVTHLEALREKGAEFLVIPEVAAWWLDHYREFKHHLDTHCTEVMKRPGVCEIYRLSRTSNGHHHTAHPREQLPLGKQHAADDRRHNQEAKATIDTPRFPAASNLRRLNGDADCSDTRLIAFYLPQFHPIPENDAWWGEGFTEWRNVAKSDPLFPGHYQPHVPGDLGFYDLRCEDTRQEQVELARDYGIHGFCYYHYWFEGKRLLERPFNEVLKSGVPDFPFCLCWANDPWSRKWDGRTQDLLQAQTYSPEDDLRHIHWLLPAIADPRAIRVGNRPIFLVYRVQHLPDARRTTDLWRDEVRKAGLDDIYLVAVETAWDDGWDATKSGFDATVHFQPQFGTLITSAQRIAIPGKPNLQVYDYADTWRLLAGASPVSYTRFDCVVPGWDNSPRVSANAVVLHDSSPVEYEQWLTLAIEKSKRHAAGRRFVFINAWNEWAEGCHLEPDRRAGHAYLEATRNALIAAGHPDACLVP